MASPQPKIKQTNEISYFLFSFYSPFYWLFNYSVVEKSK